MLKINLNKFNINWILLNELALGTPPFGLKDFEILKKSNQIYTEFVFKDEVYENNYLKEFNEVRLSLPDHRIDRSIEKNEILNAIRIIKDLRKYGDFYLHFLAAFERSPLICMAWLIYKKSIPFSNALEYIMRVHPKSNPMQNHLKVLREINFSEVF